MLAAVCAGDCLGRSAFGASHVRQVMGDSSQELVLAYRGGAGGAGNISVTLSDMTDSLHDTCEYSKCDDNTLNATLNDRNASYSKCDVSKNSLSCSPYRYEALGY